MKRLLIFILATSFFTLGLQQQAHAQFWKKKRRHERHREEVKKKPKPVPKPVVKREKIDYPATKMKERYRVDVLLPLYLDELVKNNKTTFKDHVPDKALAGTAFYEGLKLAVDTLDENVYKIDVYVHDITGKGTGVQQLLDNKLLDESDLVIGAVTSADMLPLADFAKKHQVNFVSVLSPYSAGIMDNPYFTQAQPSLHTHCEWIGNVLKKKYGKEEVFMYHRKNTPVDETAWEYMMEDNNRIVQEIPANKRPRQEELAAMFDSTVTNVIVMPIVDIDYADSLLNDLQAWFPTYRFEIFGMPSWKSIPFLYKENEDSRIGINVTIAYYFDPTTAAGQALTDCYKKQFGGKPGDWVYHGYELFSMYAYLLKTYGTIFNPKMKDNNAVFTKYDIKPRWTKDHDLIYNENKNVYLYRYQGGSYMVEQ